MHLIYVPLRVATGAYILTSGFSKLGADEGTAQFLHAAAAGTYPAAFKSMKPTTFTQQLAYGEMAVGVAMLCSDGALDRRWAALTGFGASLMGMYFKTPSMTRDDGIRPSQEGTALAKDIWLVGAGLTLLSQGITGAAKSNAKAPEQEPSLGKAAPLTD